MNHEQGIRIPWRYIHRQSILDSHKHNIQKDNCRKARLQALA